MSSLINDSDPIIRRLVVPIISKCAAIGGFDSDSIEESFRFFAKFKSRCEVEFILIITRAILFKSKNWYNFFPSEYMHRF